MRYLQIAITAVGLFCFISLFRINTYLVIKRWPSSQKATLSLNIFCLIMTRANDVIRQDIIIETWGKRCSRLFFVYGDRNISTITEEQMIERNNNSNGKYRNLLVNIDDSYGTKWGKLRFALLHIDQNYDSSSYDWIYRVDDDAYVIMENMAKMLRLYNPDRALQFGSHFIGYVIGGQGYVGTGPGIVISRGGFRRLMDNFNQKGCNPNATMVDDVELGSCLLAANVSVGNSSDHHGHLRFLSFKGSDLINKRKNDSSVLQWFQTFSAYKFNMGFDCCSPDVVAFHYVSPDEMLMFEFLLYRVNPIRNIL